MPVVVSGERPNPPLPDGGFEAALDDETLLRDIGVANASKCRGRRQVARSQLALTFAYLFLTGSFGALIGLLLLQEGARRTGPR